MNQRLTFALVVMVCLTVNAGGKPRSPANLRGLGAEYFVSPSGRETNMGTESSPWPSATFALRKVRGGNTITLLPGTYPEPILVEYSGTPQTPTVIRSQQKWGATIKGSSGHGVYAADLINHVVIDGLEIANATGDGIKVSGSNSTVRNCWVHDSAGQGIAAHKTKGTVIEYNLVERNGTTSGLDHGVYISGTNCTIRGNVLRYNKTYGCQIYYDPPGSSAECHFYNNLVYGNRNGLTVWSPTRQTNYVFNNTILSTNYTVIAEYGYLVLRNNILGGARGGCIWPMDGAIVNTDYNLLTIANSPRGPHDVVAASPGFVKPEAGLFWLREDSAARGAATTTVVLPFDFFGSPYLSLKDLGAFQFDYRLAVDSRVLDPAATNPDFWSTSWMTRR